MGLNYLFSGPTGIMGVLKLDLTQRFSDSHVLINTIVTMQFGLALIRSEVEPDGVRNYIWLESVALVSAHALILTIGARLLVSTFLYLIDEKGQAFVAADVVAFGESATFNIDREAGASGQQLGNKKLPL